MINSAQVARDLISQGYRVVPIPAGKKGPVLKEWQSVHITLNNVDDHFNGKDMNIGVIMGPASGGLTDVDLDDPTAAAIAEFFLPPTEAVYGRLSKRRSHYLYTCRDPEQITVIKHVERQGKDRNTLVELRLGAKDAVQSVWPGSTHPSGETYEWDVEGKPAESQFEDLKKAVMKIGAGTILARHWPSKERHNMCLRVGGVLARAGWDDDEISEFMVAVQQVGGVGHKDHVENGRLAALDQAKLHRQDGKGYGLPSLKEYLDEDVVKSLDKILRVGMRDSKPIEEPQSDSGKPIIKIENLAETTQLAEELLIDGGVEFFDRSNKLFRPIVKMVETFRGRKTTTAQLIEVESAFMLYELSRRIDWFSLDRRARRWVATNPDRDVCSILLRRPGEWKFRELTGVITTPTMRPDGSILDVPGYDASTQLLLVDPPHVVVKEAPTKEDALAAMEKLEGLLEEFPFTDDVSRSVAFSCLITPVVRGAFPVAPMHVIDAPVAGSGKSYLLDTCAVIAIGDRMPVISAGGDPVEMEKRLGALLLNSQPLVTIDNVSGELGGDMLCQVITQARPLIRILGKSEAVEVDARASTFFANGNNITITADLTRRAVRCRLDSHMEQPEKRQFKGDPIAAIRADRGAYVASCLTVCRAYVAAGKPCPAPQLASFEGWSKTVRSALIWLGREDPAKSMDTLRSEDPDREALRNLLGSWSEVIGTGYGNRVSVKEVIDLATEMNGNEFKFPELQTSVRASLGSKKFIDSFEFSQYLRKKKERIVDGLRFVRTNRDWFVERDDHQTISGSRERM